jgi:hypothetical protein
MIVLGTCGVGGGGFCAPATLAQPTNARVANVRTARAENNEMRIATSPVRACRLATATRLQTRYFV